MSLQDSCAKLVFAFLVLLAGCTASPSGSIVIHQEPTGPRHIEVNGSQIPAIVDNATSVSKPEEIVVPEERVVVVIPANRQPSNDCLDSCALSCRQSSLNACGQRTGSSCRLRCGSIIEPSACASACALKDANACVPKFVEFCTAQCSVRCS